MGQAIQTKYFGPSNVKGARIKATCAADSITIGYKHALNFEENHKYAADMLMSKLGWNERNALVSGCLKDGSYVHVPIPRRGSKK